MAEEQLLTKCDFPGGEFYAVVAMDILYTQQRTGIVPEQHTGNEK